MEIEHEVYLYHFSIHISVRRLPGEKSSWEIIPLSTGRSMTFTGQQLLSYRAVAAKFLDQGILIKAPKKDEMYLRNQQEWWEEAFVEPILKAMTGGGDEQQP